MHIISYWKCRMIVSYPSLNHSSPEDPFRLPLRHHDKTKYLDHREIAQSMHNLLQVGPETEPESHGRNPVQYYHYRS